jgi:hypothetical protein
VAVIKAERTYNLLLKSKQAEVAQWVRASGLPVDDFAFIDVEDDAVITSLLYKPDHHHHFEFLPAVQWTVRYSPAEHTASSDWQNVGQWEFVLERVGWWLGYLKRELDTPDPWAAFAELSTPFNHGDGDDGNAPFTDDERLTLSAKLEDIKTYLLNEGAKSEEDRHAIMDGINRANHELGKRGRIDWRTFTLGVLAELIMFGYATPEGVRYAVNLLVGSAQHLLR